MAQMDDFESLLKEVVQAKRLSASKMSKLTEVSLKLMEEDTQLVSILYRTHKTLSSSAKISSLYVFDALSRAAKHQANKQNLSGNINSPKGNSATFLLRIEGILEGIFRDVIAAGSTELKEKAKKVLDIWVKGSTFPSTILTRLGNIMEGKENQEPSHKPAHTTTSDPRLPAQVPSTTPPTTATTTTPPVQSPLLANPQSALLALLTQAANAGAKQIGATPTPPPSAVEPTQLQQQLDASQLNLLQQLTQTAKLGTTASNPIPVFNPVPVASDIDHGSGFSRDEPYGSRMKDAEYNRYDSSDRRDYNSHHYDHVGNPRGGFRGGRGRGFRDRDTRPPLQRTSRRSRSRSPPSRYGPRRDIKPYSPPRRPSMSTLSSRDSQSVSETQANAGPETDEFGREIRPQQDEEQVNSPPVAPEVPQEEGPRTSAIDPRSPRQGSHAETSHPPSSQPYDASATSQSADMPLGLENFNVATFDFTSPVAWQSLGDMWQVTHGAVPSTEELMQFVMTAGTGGVDVQASGMGQDWGQGGWSNDGYAFPPEPQDGGHGSNFSASVSGPTLQGDEGNGSYGGGKQDGARISAQRTGHSQGTSTGSRGGLGGRMQRVGDKWMFVKDSDSTSVFS
ncbi:hypothetical protein L218DRAFT_896109 [Marasmius fiardii PR-910]|nr:hypothetical protein L218DRAFT_896109 [Marasmius fiardii PR-910]